MAVERTYLYQYSTNTFGRREAVERPSRESDRMIIIRRDTDTRVRKRLFPPDAHISVHIIP